MERRLPILLLLAIPISAWADSSPSISSAPASLAFSRYLNLVDQDARAGRPAATRIDIEASLPKLAKHGRLQAIRHRAPQGPVYDVLHVEGDATVKQQVIARYLATEAKADEVLPASVAISPANYKFHYAGSIQNGGRRLYVFDIAPKKKREGLIAGQIWIDGVTGLAVRQAGRLVKRPSIFIRRVDITRDTEVLANGMFHRVTHLDIETRIVGHAQLTIEEHEQ